MADNVAITAGAGTDIGTDDVAGVHFQRVKLVAGALGSTVAIEGDAAGALTTRDAWKTPLGDTLVNDTADALKIYVVGSDLTSTVDASDNAIVVGNVAADAADSGSPIKVGSKVVTALKTATMVAAGDRADLLSAEDMVPYFRDLPAHPSDYLDAAVTSLTNTTETTIVTAGAASQRIYLTGLVINNGSTTATYVTIKDGTAGTTKVIVPVPAGKGGGGIINFRPPIRGTAATLMSATAADTANPIHLKPLGYYSKV